METTGKTNNNVEEATRQLQLQSHIDNIQEAIDVMLELVPAEDTEHDSRILRAMSGLEHTKRYLQEKEKKMIEELLQKQLHEGKWSISSSQNTVKSSGSTARAKDCQRMSRRRNSSLIRFCMRKNKIINEIRSWIDVGIELSLKGQ